MASCENGRQLSAYHDGELPAADAADLERHLARCDTCAAELMKLRAMSRLLSAAIEVRQVPPEAMARWRRSVRPGRDRVILRMTEMLSAAAAAILLVCSTMLWQQWNTAVRPARQPSASWESVAVRTASGPVRTLAGQLTGSPETPPDVQLANAILANSSGTKGTQP
jgi:anti-sigma factor RsiW